MVVLRLVAISFAGLAMFVTVYLLAVRTERGQLLGNAALAGQRVVLERGARGAERILESLSVASLVAGTSALIAIALVRRRPRLALMIAVTIVGSLLISELMKAVILDRPELVDPSFSPRHNSFPSGHATAAAAVAAGLVMVAPARSRGRVGILGAVYAAAVAYSTVVTGWHRPSDVAGSASIVLAVSAAASAALVWWRGSRAQGIDPPAGSPLAAVALTSAGVALILAGVLGLAGPIEALGGRRPLTEPLEDASFIALSTASIGVSFLTLALLVFGLHRAELDPVDASEVADRHESGYQH